MPPGAMTKLLVVAAGTGGHVYPALTVAQRLRSMGVDIAWFGTTAGIEARLVPAAGFPFYVSGVVGLRGKGVARWLAAPFLLLRSILQSITILGRVRPDAVLGMGGYGAGPIGLAAWLFRIPLIIHEQNVVPGLTNQILAWFATRVLEAFPTTFVARRRAIHTGNPVRDQFVDSPIPGTRCDRHGGRLRVLVLGGSQGAHALNVVVPRAPAKNALVDKLEIRHQCGPAHFEATRDHYASLEIEAEVFGYIDDMSAAYTWAEVVIARAGAMTISELAAVGVASILIPFPYATDDHQHRNARYLSDRGAAILLPEDGFDAAALAVILRTLYDDRRRVESMARAAYLVAVRDATHRITTQCLEVARG